MTRPLRYLVDVNALIAFLDEDHIHHEVAKRWFRSPGIHWSVCSFVQAGLLRHMVRPKTGGLSIIEATQTLAQLAEWPGYHFQAVTDDWETLTKPFFHLIFGHNQITDAYLLGLAIKENFVLVTFDKAILHMAGEYRRHVLLLGATPN